MATTPPRPQDHREAAAESLDRVPLAPSPDRELTDPELLGELTASLSRLEAFAARARSEATERAYRSDFAHFRAWCQRYGRRALPAEPATVGLYLGAVADHFSLATLERRLAAISVIHKDAGYASPSAVSEGPLRKIWRGLVREKTRRQHKAEPLLLEDLKRVIDHLPREHPADGARGELTLASKRDRALLLVGWTGALRRSELAALTTADVVFVPGEGINLHIRSGKTDQEGRGLLKGIPYGRHADTCPVTALRVWLRAAAITEGPLFRRFYRGGSIGKTALTAQYVSLILKRHAERVGLDEGALSAHSLRSGFITEAVRKGKNERRVKEHAGHRSWAVFSAYVKEAATFQENPAKDLGL